jgi:PTH1 family peptidyl-tRNA hydrolase
MESLAEKNWLIVGLGNPGLRYEKTRHNLGFMLIDRLAQKLQTQVRREECRALVGRAGFENQTIELAKPQTFMNLSGEAVNCLVKKAERSFEKMIVVSDDLALPFGKIRLRSKGSHGGQNGLRSIIDCLKTQDFIRLRIGIQPEHPVASASSFVLENFSKNDLAEVENILEDSVDAIFAVLRNGVEKAMAQFN